MFARNLTFLGRLIKRHFIYYLITVGGLTVGITAFFFLVTNISYELSYDSQQTNRERIYRVVSTSARMPVPMASTVRKEIAGVDNAVKVIFSQSSSRFIVRDASGNLSEEDGYFVDSTFLDVFNYNFVGTAPSRLLYRPDEIVITQTMAKKYFGDQPAVGKTIEFMNTSLRTRVYNVAAVIEDPQANSVFDFDFLIPFVQYGAAESENWRIHLVYTYLLIAPNANLHNITSEIRQLMATRSDYEGLEIDAIRIQPLSSIHFDSSLTSDYGVKNRAENLWILASIAVLILVIAAINFVNLSTARAADRLKEVSMKKILGAARRTLVVQFLSEAMMVAVVSCVLSVLMIFLLSPAFEAMTGMEFKSGWKAIGNYRWLLISFPFVVGLLAGIYPAIVISKAVPVLALKGGRQNVRSPLRTALVVVQFSITTFLIIGTGVIVGQLDYMQNKDLGFDDDLAVILNVGGPGIGTRIDVAKKLFTENPNVVSVSGTLTLPGDHTYTMPYSSLNIIDDGDTDELSGFYIDHDFISNMKIEILDGRTFSKDIGTDTLNFILNETAVKQMRAKYGESWDHPVGQKLNYFRSNDTGWYIAKQGEVIGVVKDFNFASLHHSVGPMAIQVDYKLMYKLVVKIRPNEISSTLNFLEAKWKELDIIRPFNYQFLDEKIAGFYQRESKFRSMFLVFAVLSIVISCVGLYGLVLYTTERRSREMSIRKVLGAGAYHLAVLIGSSFFKPVVIAFVIACPVAYYSMSQWLGQFAFREEVGVAIFLEAGFLCSGLAIVTVFSRILKVSRANPVKYIKEN